MKTLLKTLGVGAGALLLTIPLAAASQSTSNTKAWPAETLSGKIMQVLPNQRLVIVQKDGVPYDLRVTAHTKIQTGNQKLTLQSLALDQNQKASVRFTPEGRGDIASTIQVMG